MLDPQTIKNALEGNLIDELGLRVLPDEEKLRLIESLAELVGRRTMVRVALAQPGHFTAEDLHLRLRIDRKDHLPQDMNFELPQGLARRPCLAVEIAHFKGVRIDKLKPADPEAGKRLCLKSARSPQTGNRHTGGPKFGLLPGAQPAEVPIEGLMVIKFLGFHSRFYTPYLMKKDSSGRRNERTLGASP